MLVLTGGVITNAGYTRVAVGSVTNADYNSLIVSNGGRFYQARGALEIGGYFGSGYFMGGSSNRIWIDNGSIVCDADGGVGFSTTTMVIPDTAAYTA